MNSATRLAAELATPRAVTLVRYATVISTAPAAGTAVVRPSHATATDGSQDITARYLMPSAPLVGAAVRIEAHQGDVIILGAPAVDTLPATPFAMASGFVTVTLTAATTATNTGTYPTGRFTVAPLVQLTKLSAAGAAALLIPMMTANSPTGLTVGLWDAASVARTVAVNVHWTAVQMTSTSAAG